MPITGVSPVTIPILMAKWKKKIEATLLPYTRLKVELCRSANTIRRRIRNPNNNKTAEAPMNPCSSPTVQKIKSVSCSGTYFSLVCVPFRKPFPVSPPEPIAIFD